MLKHANIEFLADTVAQLSVLPIQPSDRREICATTMLRAVNAPTIKTNDHQTLHINLGFRRLLPQKSIGLFKGPEYCYIADLVNSYAVC